MPLFAAKWHSDFPNVNDRTSPTVQPAGLLSARWWIASAEIAACPVHFAIGMPVPLLPVLALAIALAVLAWLERDAQNHGWLALGFVLDIAQISAVLWLCGGAVNPFTALLLVVVAAATLRLPLAWHLPIALLAVAAFALLLFGDTSLAAHREHLGPAFALHLQGMWVAFAFTAGLVVLLVGRLTKEIAQRDRALSEVRARENRFAALATLAAGTAHELATPLGTVAIAASEIAAQSSGETLAHAERIREQVRRCKEIITHMLAPSDGEEAPASTDLADLARDAARDFSLAHPEVTLDVAQTSVRLALPRAALRTALLTVLDNAAFAARQSEAPRVSVVCGPCQGGARVSVEDNGPGVLPEHRAHLGEPFFTTKDPGQGSGLGLYVVRALVEKLGGRLEFEFMDKTRVSLWLPVPK